MAGWHGALTNTTVMPVCLLFPQRQFRPQKVKEKRTVRHDMERKCVGLENFWTEIDSRSRLTISARLGMQRIEFRAQGWCKTPVTNARECHFSAFRSSPIYALFILNQNHHLGSLSDSKNRWKLVKLNGISKTNALTDHPGSLHRLNVYIHRNLDLPLVSSETKTRR